MIQRAIRLNRWNISYRSLSGIQNVLSNFNNPNNNKLNTEDDEKLCEDLISATRKFKIISDEATNNLSSSLIPYNDVYFRLKHHLNCSETEAKKMVKENGALEELSAPLLKKSIEHLLENEISAKSIVKNAFLITMNAEILQKKMDILKLFKGFAINDLVPLLQVSTSVLNRAYKIHEEELRINPNTNRIIYMSKKLKVEVGLVSKYFATHMFMFEIPYEMLEKNLKTLLAYELDPIHILRDLWVFKYDPERLKERFEFVKNTGRKTLRPWMVRCRMDVLKHSNSLFQQNKNLLGEDSIVDYLSKRLGYDTFTMKTIVSKHPLVLRCRVTKIKEVLDYLLNETDFQKYEIASVIRILTHSKETTKQRINELKSIGCRPSTLTIVCRSQKEYNKFVKEWIEKTDKHRN